MLVSYLAEVCLEHNIICCAQHETASFVSLSLRDEAGGETINNELKKQEIGDRSYEVRVRPKYNPDVQRPEGRKLQRCFVTLKQGVPVDWEADRLLQSLIKLNGLPGTAEAPKRFTNAWQNVNSEALAFVADDEMAEALEAKAKKKEGLFLGLSKCYFKINGLNSGVGRPKKN